MTTSEPDPTKWGSATLRIESAVLNGREISSRLALIPSSIHERGEVISKRLASAPRRTKTLWLFESGLDSSCSLEEHLQRLLQQIEPAAHKLVALTDCEPTLFCGFFSESGQSNFVFETGMMTRIVSLRIPLIICLYPPSLDE